MLVFGARGSSRRFTASLLSVYRSVTDRSIPALYLITHPNESSLLVTSPMNFRIMKWMDVVNFALCRAWTLPGMVSCSDRNHSASAITHAFVRRAFQSV